MTLAFNCAPEILRRLADRHAKVVESKSKVPILSNLLIAADASGHLAITATDGQITAVATSGTDEVEIERTGATTIPATLLRDFLKKLGKVDRLSFSASETLATIRAGRSTFKLHTLPAEDFPEAKVEEAGTVLRLTTTQLRRIEKACSFAMSRDEARWSMCGLFLHVPPTAPDRLTAVASDGHRLARLRLEVEGEVGAIPPVIVPSKAVGLFETIADAAGETQIRVEIGETLIAFDAGELRIVAKAIDGKFPDYERVIPAEQPHAVEVERTKLKEALERVATIVSERGSAAAFQFADGALSLTMKTENQNAGEDEIEIEGGPDLRIGFNARYALAAIDSFETHGLELALGDPASPAILRAPGDDSRLVVLMPMRV